MAPHSLIISNTIPDDWPKESPPNIFAERAVVGSEREHLPGFQVHGHTPMMTVLLDSLGLP